MTKEFYENFNMEDRLKLKKYFGDLNQQFFLTNIETKLFNEDFEKAILYYCSTGKTIDEIIKLLAPKKLGTYYKDDATKWYPLDNAAKIYPLGMKSNWMSVFRVSCYLKENIVPEILQIALTYTIERFPTFRTSIRKGFFWHYIDEIKRRFYIIKDNTVPVRYINVSNLGRQSFKTLYYQNRISVEYFHILTDGYGGAVFLLTLVNTYLELLGYNGSYNDMVLNVTESYQQKEVIDEFITHKKNVKTNSLVDSKALELDGKLSKIRPCQLLHFNLKTMDLKKLSKKYQVTITELMLTFIFMACSFSTSQDGYIKIQVPVNMRKYNNSKTLRNFSLYIVISIKKSMINNFEDVLNEIHFQTQNKNNEKYLNETMSYTNKLVNYLKLIPMFIKRPIAKLVYGYLGDKVLTTVLSNLGEVNITDEMKQYVNKMDFCLGTGITNKSLFSMVSCNGVTTLTMTKFTTNSSVENHLYNLMQQYNLNPIVEGSELYENK